MTGVGKDQNNAPRQSTGEALADCMPAAKILDMQTESLHESLGRLASPLGDDTLNDEARIEPLIEQIHKTMLAVMEQYISKMNANNRHATICSMVLTYLAEIKKRNELFQTVWPGCEPLNETAEDVHDRIDRIVQEAQRDGDLAGAASVIAFMMHYEMNVDVHDVISFINKDRADE